jgi:hypothetical protein
MILIENIRTFLETPRIAYLSTINLKGYPHTVPVWFAMDGDDLIFSATRGRARVKYLQANPKGAVAIGGNLGETEGYLIQGIITIEEDASHPLLTQIVCRYVGPEAMERFLGRVQQEERIIFGDTRKLLVR